MAASALPKSLTLKFFYVMGKALSGELSCPFDRSCLRIGDNLKTFFPFFPKEEVFSDCDLLFKAGNSFLLE